MMHVMCWHQPVAGTLASLRTLSHRCWTSLSKAQAAAPFFRLLPLLSISHLVLVGGATVLVLHLGPCPHIPDRSNKYSGISSVLLFSYDQLSPSTIYLDFFGGFSLLLYVLVCLAPPLNLFLDLKLVRSSRPTCRSPPVLCLSPRRRKFKTFPAQTVQQLPTDFPVLASMHCMIDLP